MKKFPENIFVGDSIFLLEKKTLKRGFRRSERVDGKGAKKERVKRSEVRGKGKSGRCEKEGERWG